jgi:hypothetical protein
MKLNDGKYLCPFCVSSWDCDGPHIEEKDLNNFYERLGYIREDLTLLALEEIDKYEASAKIDLSLLKRAVFESLIKRSLN